MKPYEYVIFVTTETAGKLNDWLRSGAEKDEAHVVDHIARVRRNNAGTMGGLLAPGKEKLRFKVFKAEWTEVTAKFDN